MHKHTLPLCCLQNCLCFQTGPQIPCHCRLWCAVSFFNKEYLRIPSVLFTLMQKRHREDFWRISDCVMSCQMNQIRGILQAQHCLASLGWDVSQIWDSLPHGNSKPMEIQAAKFISHPLPCNATSIPQLGQTQSYQHSPSPLIKPSPPFSLINRMKGCAGEGRSLGTV